jgi:hypothetical protein
MLLMICLLGELILPLATILIFGFETVSTVWYFFVFLLFANSNALPLTDYVILASSSKRKGILHVRFKMKVKRRPTSNTKPFEYRPRLK